MPSDPKEIVMSYVAALDSGDYETARDRLGANVRVVGPAGEAFRSPAEFIEMLSQQRGKYDLKKIFVDGDDVCVLYDFVTPKVRTFFCSWYQVRDGKIVSIQTVFDPRAFSIQWRNWKRVVLEVRILHGRPISTLWGVWGSLGAYNDSQQELTLFALYFSTIEPMLYNAEAQ
jgi:limonene-1,2-epoxide hydrolase